MSWTIGHLRHRLKKGVRVTYYPRRMDQPLIPQVDIFCDAGFATTMNGRSLMGYVIMLNGSLVAYRSAITKCATTSTTSAEVFGMCFGVKEGISIWQMLAEIGIDVAPLKTGIDNSACTKYAHGATDKSLKHLNYRTRYVEDMVDGGIVEIIKVPTEVNLSDPLSKVMRVAKTQNFLSGMLMDVGYLLPGYKNPRLDTM